jgi:hypothetical protein
LNYGGIDGDSLFVFAASFLASFLIVGTLLASALPVRVIVRVALVRVIVPIGLVGRVVHLPRTREV